MMSSPAPGWSDCASSSVITSSWADPLAHAHSLHETDFAEKKHGVE
jgi:hypothetical protein